MTEEDFKKLKFKECTHATFDTEYHSFYECISEPLKGRLYVDSVIRRDKYTGVSIGKGSVGYFLDGKFYETRRSYWRQLKILSMENNRCSCINCKYCENWGSILTFRCKLNKYTTSANPNLAVCMYDRDNIGKERALKVLHDYQKYRRGYGDIRNCPPPYVIGIAIDKALRCMRTI